MELISREDAIKCLDGRGLIMATTPKVAVRKYSAMVRTRIEVLPTIEERKEGEWIPYLPEYKDMFKCSECKGIVRLPYKAIRMPYKYCPYCGTEMKGE